MSWPSINPGDLRHQVQIQVQSSAPDSFGQPQQSWTTVLATYARIETVKQNELYQTGSLTSQVTHTITMRCPSGVSVAAGMRVLYGAHVYKIQASNNIEERNILLKLMVLEIDGTE